MKHTLLIIAALMLVVGCSEPINIDELVERDGIWHSKDTNKPYSGKAVKYLENGQKDFEVTLKNGKADGKATEWYENGQKGFEGTFKDGELIGKLTYWYENGQKGSEGTFKDGSLISVKCWDEDGNEIDCSEL